MHLLKAPWKLVLGSKSPRRQQLLKDLGFHFSIRPIEVDENHSKNLKGVEIAEHLSRKKAEAHFPGSDEIILTSDTVVWADNESLAKARNASEAKEMLLKLSGKTHEVITAFCLSSKNKTIVKSDICSVTFTKLSILQIEHYIHHFKPYDKAGAYGIQEWIGMVAVEKIEGSYFTVMGLPTHLVFQELINW